LLELVKPFEPLWVAYEQELRLLTDYAVEFRNPGASADLEIAKRAQKLGIKSIIYFLAYIQGFSRLFGEKKAKEMRRGT
jgi:hypothetical protein